MKHENSSNTQASIDDRYLPRWEVRKKVLCFVNGDKPHACETRDLHCSGVHIRSKKKLPADASVRLQIYLSEEVPIDMDGHVVWSQIEANEFEYGILFDKITQKAVDQIFQKAFELRKKTA